MEHNDALVTCNQDHPLCPICSGLITHWPACMRWRDVCLLAMFSLETLNPRWQAFHLRLHVNPFVNNHLSLLRPCFVSSMRPTLNPSMNKYDDYLLDAPWPGSLQTAFNCQKKIFRKPNFPTSPKRGWFQSIIRHTPFPWLKKGSEVPFLQANPKVVREDAASLDFGSDTLLSKDILEHLLNDIDVTATFAATEQQPSQPLISPNVIHLTENGSKLYSTSMHSPHAICENTGVSEHPYPKTDSPSGRGQVLHRSSITTIRPFPVVPPTPSPDLLPVIDLTGRFIGFRPIQGKHGFNGGFHGGAGT